jgi:acyl-homoserine-lactone acylase
MLNNSLGAVCKQFLLLVCLFCVVPGMVKGQSHKTEIIWDTYGVPHIFGRNMEEMYYSFGWAQMHNHANLILQLYAQARGKAAEYWGEKYLSSDKQIQLFNIPALAGKEYNEQGPEFKSYLDAFVKGINEYAMKHPGEISQANVQVLPVTPQDIIAHCIRVLFLRFVAYEDIGIATQMTKPGSNSYAIAPSRSASKNAMLLANPHLSWYDFFTFFEAHLQGPGFNAYGAALVGIPVLTIAFNDHLGWTHTVNTIDASDRYELKLQGNGYLLDGVTVPFEERSVVLKIKQADGTLREQPVTFTYSRQGPVIGRKGDKAYAIRIAGFENHDLLYQWHMMAKAQNWGQFESAVKMMQLPMFNVIYADSKGNILYLFAGNVPRRSEGDWKFWHGVVDGSESKYIWNETLSYADLPKLFDPGTGFVQNSNDPPWNCTYPGILDPHKYPAYISPEEMELRPQRAVNMIKDVPSVTYDELIGFKLNTGMEGADRFLGDLLAAAGHYPDSTAAKAAAVLRKWDKKTDSDSRGAVLFATWFDKMSVGMFNKNWDPSFPIGTPSGLKDPKGAVDSLINAAKEVKRDYDSLDVAWGDVYRFRWNQYDYPANGGEGRYGIYRAFYFRQDKDKRYRAVGGDSYVAVIEFGKKPTARVLLSYGNASQPGNKHVGDQLLLLSQKKMRFAWLEKKDILVNSEEREQLDIESLPASAKSKRP